MTGFRVEPWTGRSGLQISGEINVLNRQEWQSALAAAQPRTPAGGDMHLDLSGVTSVDAGGAAVIAALATRLWPDGRLVLHRPPAGLCRILQVLWPELPGIEVRP